MTADTTNPPLALTKVFFRSYLTYGVDARTLHRALSVREKFTDWMSNHVASGNFLENQDFILRRRSDGASENADYFVSLDMAKTLAILAPSSPAKTIVRRFLLSAEKKTVAGKLLSDRLTFDRDIDEIIDARVHEVFVKKVPSLLAALVTDRRIQVRYGKTAGQIWRDKGFPPLRGVYRWFGNRLQQAGCMVDGGGYGELGNSRARLFDPDKANRWLEAGGKQVVEQKILEVLGQGAFDFAHPPHRKL